MGTLAFERGALTLGQQLGFAAELDEIVAAARARGGTRDPYVRGRLAAAWSRVQIMRYSALRSLTALSRGEVTRETAVSKLFWADLHRDLGELGVDVLGVQALVDGDAGADDAADGRAEPGRVEGLDYRLSAAQRRFLYTRADTIYGGSNEIQRNVIGERALGLPPEPKVV